jgi:hypothetical protein
VILCAASWVGFGQVFPPTGDQGFWFYTALLGLLIGSRLDTPFFAKPADVIIYAAPAAVALAPVYELAQVFPRKSCSHKHLCMGHTMP